MFNENWARGLEMNNVKTFSCGKAKQELEHFMCCKNGQIYYKF